MAKSHHRSFTLFRGDGKSVPRLFCFRHIEIFVFLLYTVPVEERGEVSGVGVSQDTMKFAPINNHESAEEIIMRVFEALEAKGYDPITQLVGYLLSGDPTYITSYQGARSLICRLERDEIMEELAQFYVDGHAHE